MRTLLGNLASISPDASPSSRIPSALRFHRRRERRSWTTLGVLKESEQSVEGLRD
jgi:hypothetical protein